MQRLHEADLVGHLLDKMADGGTHYEHLMLPMEFEPERRCLTSLGFRDPRSEKGDLMWPGRFDAHAVQELKQDLGSYAAAAQLQQRPAPEGGGLFKDHWWRFWIPHGAQVETFGRPHMELPDGSLHWYDVQPLPHARHMQQMQSWDCAFKGKQTSDYVAGLAAGVAYPHIYVLDQVHAKMDIVQTIQAIQQLSDEYPKAHAKLIEDKANGPAVMQLLRDKVHGLLAYNPEGNKVARASALAPIVEAGNVWLPHPKIAPWVWDFIAEFSQFPYAAYDDRVDALGQLVQWALDRMGRKKKVKARARA
jgi:predicted phage terminase large subunit-like protein